MIPEFPKFKKIELSDKKDIEKFTSKFPPYSDFNFYNMWAWDIHNKMVLSQLNGNLVVLFNDYVNSEEFLAFLGEKRAAETASILIAYSKDKHKKGFLKFVPEEVILAFKNLSFIVKADKDSFDYVYLVEHLAIMKNWHKNTSGKRIRRFLKTGIKYTIKHSSPEDITKDQEKYKEFFKKWAEDKNIKDHYKLYEYKAFERFLTIKDKNIHFVTLFFGERMVGFTVYEILSKDYAVSHFAKADKEHYAAISDLLNWEEAKILHAKGIKYFNWEQDLGIPGLRYAKEKYKPAFVFKKYIVSNRV